MSAETAPRLTPRRQVQLRQRVRLLVSATIGYNIIEAGAAIAAGTVASSAALVAFGLDSVVEVTSATAVAWQFTASDPQTREKTALRVIAFSFFALAAYITTDSILALTTGGEEASPSPIGIVLAAASLVIMPLLSLAQRRAGRLLGSVSAVADSKQTLICTYLSGVLLIGLVLNATLGWGWADPVVALVIATAAAKEGRDAWQGRACCATPVPDLASASNSDDTCGCGPHCTDTCCPPSTKP